MNRHLGLTHAITLLNREKQAQIAERNADRRRRHAAQKAKVEALQNKRDQWKAASARYYERHPELKEKKRVKMAEKRCVRYGLAPCSQAG
jgi:uncharacterized protein involved in exopolysaccharide biosynthesis